MISIIGAGPAGCYAAYLLAKAGKEVSVFEEHNKIGEPVQCTGIVTSAIKRIIDVPDSCIVNKIKKARIYAPNGKFIEVKFKDENLILDRKKFDNYLADIAVKAGAKIFLGNKFKNYDALSKVIETESGAKIKTDILIGADGPNSSVANSSGLISKHEFWTGIQARVKLKNDNAVEFYPFFGSFGWIVPENKEIVRIGLLGKGNVRLEFEKFLKFSSIIKKEIIEYQGGLVPVYCKKHLQKENIYLVGDAALQVKATTAGGIVQGMTASKCLAESIIEKTNYEKKIKRLNLELWTHLKIRKILDRFSEKDYNNLVEIFNKDKNKRVLEEYDRDNIVKLGLKLALTEPKIIMFMGKLI